MAKTPSTSDSKTTVKKATAAPVKTRTKTSDAAPVSPTSPEDRERMIQYAAYHLAEKDGFQAGREHDYWTQAEQQINSLLQAAPQNSTEQH